jgi:acyl-CoA synthetase (AMP-forming)/AMP-acid ligase II
MKGYYKMPEATSAAIDKDGWLHTGDLACRTPDGNFKITGRLKDMIIRGGENIYPKEIEEFIYTNPKVSDVQVIGVPDKAMGEEIMACIILKEDETMTADEMKQYISDANYLVIEANHDVEMLKAGHYPEHLKRRILSNIGHLSNEACALALCENATPKLRHVWLCHLSDENNHPELARTTIANILREHGIIADTDFQLDTLRRKLPSEINVLE